MDSISVREAWEGDGLTGPPEDEAAADVSAGGPAVADVSTDGPGTADVSTDACPSAAAACMATSTIVSTSMGVMPLAAPDYVSAWGVGCGVGGVSLNTENLGTPGIGSGSVEALPLAGILLVLSF